MLRAFSPRLLMTATALAFVTLSACATSGPARRPDPQVSDPVVTNTVETRKVCPAELDQPIAAAPSPAPDAKITANASGQAYLAAVIVWGQSVAKLFTDAAADCHNQVGAAR